MRKRATKATIPPELKHKISQPLLMFTGGAGIFFRILLLASDHRISVSDRSLDLSWWCGSQVFTLHQCATDA